MFSHPDADAFLRAILHNLDDATPRLVFADWLEETDNGANTAWARYIRIQAELAAQPPVGGRWGELEVQAADEALGIHTTLRVPARLFVEQTQALLRLLPAERLSVDLTGFTVPRSVAEYVPASLAHERLLLPLAVGKSRMYLAMVEPRNVDTLEILEFILNRRVTPIAANPASIPAAIERAYGPVNAEFYDPFIECTEPRPGTDSNRPELQSDNGTDGPAEHLANQILHEARLMGAARVMISPIGGPRIRFRVAGEWIDRGPWLPSLLPPVTRRFAEMAGILGEFQQVGRGQGAFEWSIPGDPVLVRVALETVEEGPVVQIDFAGMPPVEF